MRLLILLGPLALAACGDRQAADNQVNATEAAAEAIVSNDTTAIDAVMNQAAAMAEDEAAITLNAAESAGDDGGGTRSTSRGSARPRPATGDDTSADTPDGDSAEPTGNNAVTNAE